MILGIVACKNKKDDDVTPPCTPHSLDINFKNSSSTPVYVELLLPGNSNITNVTIPAGQTQTYTYSMCGDLKDVNGNPTTLWATIQYRYQRQGGTITQWVYPKVYEGQSNTFTF